MPCLKYPHSTSVARTIRCCRVASLMEFEGSDNLFIILHVYIHVCFVILCRILRIYVYTFFFFGKQPSLLTYFFGKQPSLLTFLFGKTTIFVGFFFFRACVCVAGCQVVKTYCGHGIGELFHTLPTVPHYPKNKAKGVMKPGHIFTIEPMINLGTWQARCVLTCLRRSWGRGGLLICFG